MAEYKSKPARIVDKVRKMWKRPAGSGTVNFGTTIGGVTGGTGGLASTHSSPTYKKKPPRKGRPD